MTPGQTPERVARRRASRTNRGLVSAVLLGGAVLAPRLAHASGSGDLGPAFRDAYLYGFVPVGIALPEYSLRVDGEGAHNGIQWEVPFIVATRNLDPPIWGGGASISWYPGAGDVMLRGTGRLVIPLRSSEESWQTEVPGIGVGLGGFWHDQGYGPRVEARLRYFCWVGVFFSAAWEPTVSPSFSHGGEVAAGLEIPFPFGL